MDMPARPPGRHRCWCITINNWTENDYKLALLAPYRYIIIGRERSETNTPHLQIYLELKNPISFNSLRTHFPRGHMETREGSQTQARDYCKKEHYAEYGVFAVQGKRNDFTIAKKLLEDGVSIRDAIQDGSIMSTGTLTAYEKLQKYYVVHRTRPRVFWIYGPGGSGKTTKAYQLSGNDVYKVDLLKRGWFDGYDRHKAIIIDDLEVDTDDKDLFSLLLGLLDKNPYVVNVKNSSAGIAAEIIIITCQQAPWQIWKNYSFTGDPCPEMYDGNVELRQIMRRITQVIHLTGEKLDRNYPDIITE